MTPASVISSFPGICARSDILQAGNAILWLNLFLSSRNQFGRNYRKKRHGAKVPKTSELISALPVLEQRELCEIWSRLCRFLGLSLWCPMHLAFRRRDLSMPMVLDVHRVQQRWTLFSVFSCFLLKSERKRKEKAQSSSPEHPTTALCLMQACRTPCQVESAAWCQWWCGLLGFLSWLPDLSGSKLLNFDVDLFLNCCSYSYASWQYPDKRPPASCRFLAGCVKTLEIDFSETCCWEYLVHPGDCKFLRSPFTDSWAGSAAPSFACCVCVWGGLPAPQMRNEQ